MSDIVKNWTDWLNNTRFSAFSEEQRQQTFAWLFSVRDKILTKVDIQAGDVVVDIGTGTGLLAFGAYEILQGNGLVIASDKFSDCTDECAQIAEALGIKKGFKTLVSAADSLDLPSDYADKLVMRSVLVHILDKRSCAKEFYRVLKAGGVLSFFEPVMSSNTKYYELIDPSDIDNYEKFKHIEDEITHSKDDPITNFDEKTLVEIFKEARFSSVELEKDVISSTYVVNAQAIPHWFDAKPSPDATSLKEKFLTYVDEKEFLKWLSAIQKALDNKEITVSTNSAYIKAVK